MPEKNRSSRTEGVPHHPLVEALAADPNQPPKPSTRLFGFPGPAADSSSTRLWLDEGLSSYVDVPDDAILHHRTLDNDEGTILWVDPTATLTHSAPQAQEVQADFLGGAIAQRNLAAAPARNQASGPFDTYFIFCPTTFWWECSFTSGPHCPESYYPFCLEKAPIAGPAVPVSRAILCPSLVSARCQSPQPFCGPVQSTIRICISKTVRCPEEFASFPACLPEPVDPGISPVVDPIGPFRPRQR
jgi:hypothetical protein